MSIETTEKIHAEVRQAYGQIAGRVLEKQDVTTSANCCSPVEVAEEANTGYAIQSQLYSEGELANLPESVTEASMGCGNPTAVANLQPGDVALDLGSGGGIDCFLAAKQVGPTGRVIGLDTTPDMVKLARHNAKKMGVTNVDFRYGEMEEVPLPDESVDVIISNCVINLSPDKDAVFAESFRVLKPGGRIVVSDIVTHGELPSLISTTIEAWAGCLGGALSEEAFLGKMQTAGLTDVTVTQRDFIKVDDFLDLPDVQEMIKKISQSLPLDWLREQVDGKIASIKVTAHKPE